MFERFTERARQVVILAQEEARSFNHNYIGTEHLLLGLLREEEGIAARVLGDFGLTVANVRDAIGRIVGQSDETYPEGQIPFTPRAKKILELGLREALSLGHNYIGTEHLLLGLVREAEGVAMRILLDFDADPNKLREAVIHYLSGPTGRRREVGAELAPTRDAMKAELVHARRQKHHYIEAQNFEQAAQWRDKERKLERQLRESSDSHEFDLAEGTGWWVVFEYANREPSRFGPWDNRPQVIVENGIVQIGGNLEELSVGVNVNGLVSWAIKRESA